MADGGRPREVALFGGSFDPPHVGHLLAAAYVLSVEPVDELWFVPVHSHPFQKPLRASFDHRVELCEAMAAQLRSARVSRIEEELGGEGRTVDLLEHLREKHPAWKFALVLGSDLDKERLTWKRWDRIAELARIIRVTRGGTGSDAIPKVSSTEVRELLRSGADASRLIPRAVLERIRAAGTYR
ncbi:MAG TPA: nicotinate-nicotinamide nucleotide adenylyltransferase [Myxococcales bacterium]|jgi:nicotinate-nucleotide adenylyltransferase